MTNEMVFIEDGKPIGYLTVAEYAKKAGITPGAVKQRIHRHLIIPTKIGGRNYIPEGTVVKRMRPGQKPRSFEFGE